MQDMGLKIAEEMEMREKQLAQTNAALTILKDAKVKVEQVVAFIKQMEKKNGRTALSKNAIKTMERFLKCNITNPAIFTRYQEVMVLMEKYAHIARGEENAEA